MTVGCREYLLKLINRSWEEENCPKRWKFSLIIPILKPNKDPQNIESYRPISIISTEEKVMEKMIVERLNWRLEEQILLSKTQFGFRPLRSTQDSLAILGANIRNAINMEETCIVVYIDLSAAFDREWHGAVPKKMVYIGFKGKIYWVDEILFI